MTDMPHEMELHNIKQVLGLIRMLSGKNSEMPRFIIKLYTVWMFETLNNLSLTKTMFPKEDIEMFRALYKDHFEVAAKLIEDMLKSAETIEHAKLAAEQKKVGM